MNNSESKKSFEELADEALDNVTGGKSVMLLECAYCGSTDNRVGPDGKPYCRKHYIEKFGTW